MKNILKNLYFTIKNNIKSNNFQAFLYVLIFVSLPIILNGIIVEHRKIESIITLSLSLIFPIFIFTNKIKAYLLFI